MGEHRRCPGELITIPTIKVREYPDGSLAVSHGPRRIAASTAQGGRSSEPVGNIMRLRNNYSISTSRKMI
jgi:hypothetical protein